LDEEERTREKCSGLVREREVGIGEDLGHMCSLILPDPSSIPTKELFSNK
jgi:hypothetical protein